MPSTIGTVFAEAIRDQRAEAEWRRLAGILDRTEVHIRALAAAAAQAQLAMQQTGPAGQVAGQGTHGWTERYDALAHNLAEPALDELAALRRLLQLKAIDR
jgi:hypothetical protein